MDSEDFGQPFLLRITAAVCETTHSAAFTSKLLDVDHFIWPGGWPFHTS
jgi:hypothetical protein